MCAQWVESYVHLGMRYVYIEGGAMCAQWVELCTYIRNEIDLSAC